MKMRNLVLLGLLLLGLQDVSQSQTYYFDNFTYISNADQTITITGFTQNYSPITIPAAINGLPVTGIAELYDQAGAYLAGINIPASVTNIAPSAFSYISGLTTLTVDPNNPVFSTLAGVLYNKDQTVLIRCPENKGDSLVIPGTVTNLADYAFYYCVHQTNITLPNGVIRIGNSAFEVCSSLTGITLPASVASLGTNVFRTSSLTAITVDALNPVYSDLAGVLFNKDQTVLLAYPMGLTNSYTIPETVTNLGDSAFYSCQLHDIIISTNVTTLGKNVFGSCFGLTSLAIPASITSIGDSDFSGCGNLTNVSIPDTVTHIGNKAFAGCRNLINLPLPGSLLSIGDAAFFYSGLTNFPVPAGVTNIGAYAFSECDGLTRFTIPAGVNQIEAGTFSACANLADITIPSHITGIGDNAFSYSGITNLTIPNSITNLGNAAFSHCPLQRIMIGDSVTSIGSNTFERCLGLVDVTIGAGVTSIGDSAFSECEHLTSLEIPNGVTSIGNSAFYYCIGLTNVILGNHVANIQDEAFYANLNLADVSFPSSLTNIGSYTFGECLGFHSVMIPSNVASIGNTAFANCHYLNAINVNEANSFYSSLDGVLFNKGQTTLIAYPGGRTGAYVMPDTVTNVGDYAFYYCQSMDGISLSDRLTTIGNYAFNNCSSLSSITIPSSVILMGDQAFGSTSLKKIHLLGNAPVVSLDLFAGDIYLANNTATAYYLPGTTGWGSTFGYLPLVLWNPTVVTDDSSFGMQNNHFGFNIAGNANLDIIVEASTNLINWQPVQTNTLTSGSAYFSDPQSTDYPVRYYRLCPP